jgi:hypothetical protein
MFTGRDDALAPAKTKRVGRRLGAASMKKKKNNEPAKGGHGVGVFDLMGMASAESEGVGVGERERRNFVG